MKKEKDLTERKTLSMNVNAAMGWLIMGHYNIATAQDYGCCPFECGPCSAMDWMRLNVSTYAEVAVRATGEWEGYSWMTPEGHIDWQPLLDAWTKGKAHCNCKGLGIEGALANLHGMEGDGEDD